MAELERLHESDELDAYFEARRLAFVNEYREEGQLALLGRLTSRRFGAATAEALLAALAGGGDHAHLEAVADLVLDCETGQELLDHVNGKPGS